MEINKILFCQMAQDRDIGKTFEDFDVNGDNVINEQDAATGDKVLAGQIKELINTVDENEDIEILSDFIDSSEEVSSENNNGDVLCESKLSSQETEKLIRQNEAELVAMKQEMEFLIHTVDFQTRKDSSSPITAKYHELSSRYRKLRDETDSIKLELYKKKVSENIKKYGSDADIGQSIENNFYANFYSGEKNLKSLSLSELECMAANGTYISVYLRGPIEMANLNAIVKEPDWEIRLQTLLSSDADGNAANMMNGLKDAAQKAEQYGGDKKYTSLFYYYTGTSPAYYCPKACDFNGDGITDFNDLNEFPDELDLDGDGNVSQEEKQYLREYKHYMYGIIDYACTENVGSLDINQIIAREEFRANNPLIVEAEKTLIDLYLNPSHCDYSGDNPLSHLEAVEKTMEIKYGLPARCFMLNRNSAYWFWNRQEGDGKPTTLQEILDYHDTTKLYTKILESSQLTKSDYKKIIDAINNCKNETVKEKLQEILKIAKSRLE